jgi:Fe-S cluster assembly iron-binding protein IscA
VLTLTPSATGTIEQILSSPTVPDGAGIRITPSMQVMDGSSSGEELIVAVAEQPGDGDQVIEEGGARVFVEDSLADPLDDMSLDANVVDQEVRFMLGGQADPLL